MTPAEAQRDEDDERWDGAEALARACRIAEALLFASTAPLSAEELAKSVPANVPIEKVLASLEQSYAMRGVTLKRVAGGFAFRTAPDLAYLLAPEAEAPRRLSRAALEILSIIAYHQPVTRAEIEEIRGVALSRGTIDQLMELDWIRLGRRRMTPGRPVTFVVTDHFLDHFGLESARDLPGLKELRAAGLLDSRPLPSGFGQPTSDDEEEAQTGQSELFED